MHRNAVLAYSNFDTANETEPAVERAWPSFKGEADERLDHFVSRDGQLFAGTHLILDLWGAAKLDNLEVMEHALRTCVDEAAATLLHSHLHHFTPNGGISGVAVLAESHISVHTWPERDYAAFDVFMCGDAKPERCEGVLRAAFEPKRMAVHRHLRGVVETPV